MTEKDIWWFLAGMGTGVLSMIGVCWSFVSFARNKIREDAFKQAYAVVHEVTYDDMLKEVEQEVVRRLTKKK